MSWTDLLSSGDPVTGDLVHRQNGRSRSAPHRVIRPVGTLVPAVPYCCSPTEMGRLSGCSFESGGPVPASLPMTRTLGGQRKPFERICPGLHIRQRR